MRIGILASGTGTILQAMLRRGPAHRRRHRRPAVRGRRARRRGLEFPSRPIARESFGADFDRLAYTHRVVDALDRHTTSTWSRWPGSARSWPSRSTTPTADRILNTHPALLPSFKGWHAVDDALAAGVKVTGCTVHFATLEVDDGPILAQEAVPVLPDDTAETLHERIKAVERRLYPESIWQLVRDPTRRG